MNFAAPVSEEQAIERRLAMATDDLTIRGTPVEALSRLIREVAGDEMATTVAKEAGFAGASFNMLQKYSLKQFLRFERAAAQHVAGITGGFDEAVFKIGAAAVHLFFDSVAGKTMKLLAGREPHRLLAAVPNGYSVLVNFGEREYQKTGEHSGVFTFRRELLGPVHTAGIFDAALRAVYSVEPTIALEPSTNVDFKFRISW
jgi:uncharacterized protein (TIGR02265 family)